MKPLVILGLALLSASLTHGQLPNFLKDELLDKVIGLKNHPYEKYGNYPDGLPELFNTISKQQFDGAGKAVLRQKVDVVCANKVYLEWCENRLQILWQAKAKEIHDLLANVQLLQGELSKKEGELTSLIEQADQHEAKIKELQAKIKELEGEEIKELEGDEGAGNAAFSWLSIMIIIVLIASLSGALVMWWLAKKKAGSGNDSTRPEDTQEINRLKREVDTLKSTVRDLERQLDDYTNTNPNEESDQRIIKQQTTINELRHEIMELKRR